MEGTYLNVLPKDVNKMINKYRTENEQKALSFIIDYYLINIGANLVSWSNKDRYDKYINPINEIFQQYGLKSRLKYDIDDQFFNLKLDTDDILTNQFFSHILLEMIDQQVKIKTQYLEDFVNYSNNKFQEYDVNIRIVRLNIITRYEIIQVAKVLGKTN